MINTLKKGSNKGSSGQWLHIRYGEIFKEVQEENMINRPGESLKPSGGQSTRRTISILAGLCAGMVLMFTLSACQAPRMETPAGFAEYEKVSNELQLVSPDAVRIRVYRTRNQPVGSLATLTNAVELHFQSIGYKVLRSESISTDAGLSGRLFVTSVMTMNGEYRYLASFFPMEDEVLVVEAGGRKEDFVPYERDLIAKIKTLQP